MPPKFKLARARDLKRFRTIHPTRTQSMPHCATQPGLTARLKELRVAQDELEVDYPYILRRSHNGAFRIPYYEIYGAGPPTASLLGVNPGDVYVDTNQQFTLYGYTKGGWQRWRLELELSKELELFPLVDDVVGPCSVQFSPVLWHPFAPSYSLGVDRYEHCARWIRIADLSRFSYDFTFKEVVPTAKLRNLEIRVLKEVKCRAESTLNYRIPAVSWPSKEVQSDQFFNQECASNTFSGFKQPMDTTDQMSPLCQRETWPTPSFGTITELKTQNQYCPAPGPMAVVKKSFRTKFLPASYPHPVQATRAPGPRSPTANESEFAHLSYEIAYHEFYGISDPETELCWSQDEAPQHGDIYLDCRAGEYKLYAYIPCGEPMQGKWRRWADSGHAFPNLRWSDDTEGSVILHPDLEGYALWVTLEHGIGWYRDVAVVLRLGREEAIRIGIISASRGPRVKTEGERYKDAGRILEYVVAGSIAMAD
ncbi:hypothetical protein MIND_00656800 [Mycena indigotica]|uniref:Uncharacterized protein n=1 Tax=Mycena indigotica TaxID=2126181 RepID=A0A8H6W6D3_9AGAR|nr:uncharacterized protein MIND_00656800 [Mycena indigotica]KAF7300939.1 hypothetical protein MIND_00656800 [Mycena indigotica]